MPKVLILSASTGGGHNSAANAIKEELVALGCEVSVVDAIESASPILNKIVSEGYEKSAKYVPVTYKAFYKISSGKSRKEDLDVLVRRIIGRKILHLVNDFKPDAIIGTHPFPMMALTRYKEQGTINVPVVSIITDYTAHTCYIQNSVDAYIVGDVDVSYILKNSGIAPEKIHPFGIPINSSFLNTERVNTVKKNLDLDDKFTVLVMGGSFGAGSIKESLMELLSSRYDFQIIVVTGRDVKLKAKLDELVEIMRPKKTVRILGFTKDVPELMTISNVLITKPGGLTTTEAIIKGIPMVIPYYIPGQEAENVDFLLNNGLALKTFKNYPLVTIIEILMDNPERLNEIKERMLKRSKADSSLKTAKLTLDLIESFSNKGQVSDL
ncbi:processive diacylglycerol beta-glucosyltransferase [Oxobacter pfennigii]|uniref:Processive diacylglycerol beta-glucosyltransferase n=1 Tax=Oxobacter pfennigii TaxID=36849 RepID=A0A0N8NT25_9CLOT|nr:glycosyltransferase [Oxobacter pfennigii]KPU43648.1 processive diacylglycerol beta-glucosyltransferase [Oxobacter pfennigii]